MSGVFAGRTNPPPTSTLTTHRQGTALAVPQSRAQRASALPKAGVKRSGTTELPSSPPPQPPQDQPRALPLVHLAAVPHPSHTHSSLRVINRVHNPVVTHPNPPLLPPTFQLLASLRTRLFRQRLQLRENSLDQRWRQPFQLFLALGFSST
jgi:hypothetical protein